MQDVARKTGIDWEARWRQVVEERAGAAGSHASTAYWDRRAPTFARSTRTRVDEFLDVLAPYVSARKTLIDVGAGAGRHAVPLADRPEWVTAVEPSEGMRAQIPQRDNMTVIASSWEDAEVATADLVICCHVLYGVADPVPFIRKLDAAARERVFVMMREGPMPHPAATIRARLTGGEGPGVPQFSLLFMLLMQMGIAPDVKFIRYPVVNRYLDFDEALADARALVGEAWDEARGRAMLEEMLVSDGDELVFDSGTALSGVAHWRPLGKT
jgi:SAM-dependent methyltransferase